MVPTLVYYNVDDTGRSLGEDIMLSMGEDIMLSDIQSESKIFIFYYQDPVHSHDIKELLLKTLGKNIGSDIFIYFGKVGSAGNKKMLNYFDIEGLLVIIIPGAELITSVDSMAGIKIDNQKLLSKPKEVISLVSHVNNLLPQSKFLESKKLLSQKQHKVLLSDLLSSIRDILNRSVSHIKWSLYDLLIAY